MAENLQTLRSRCEGRLAGLRTDRYSWWVHWAELARYILPRRYRWLVTPNQMNRGLPINGAIIDSTGTIAARVLASGMMSGITSPTRPWFKLTIEGFQGDTTNPITIYFDEVGRRMSRVFQESNFYNSIAIVYSDLSVFGTGPMLIHEDFENVIRCVNPCAGEYYVENGARLIVDVFYREMVMTIHQLVGEFGVENVSKASATLYRRGGAGLRQEVRVIHAIEPNTDGNEIPRHFKYRELYYEVGQTDGDGKDTWLRQQGYHEFPVICPRWDIVSNDAYGRSPGMDALGDIKQLQQETKRKAQAIDKLANPPMVADVELKNQPASLLPGGVTYITKKEGVGFKPAYENFRPPVQELMEDIKQVQERIRNVFFNDLFLMISQLQTVRTATEIDARREEKLIMLGPVLERFMTEALDPIIDRVFGIMNRADLLPTAPPEIQGKPIKIEYVSMLAEAQRAVSTSGIERMFQLVGNLAGIHPDALDTINWDESIDEYASLLGVSPKLMATPEQMAAARAMRAKAAQQQAMAQSAQTGLGAAKAAKTLSETDLGGGKNALETMLNPGGAA